MILATRKYLYWIILIILLLSYCKTLPEKPRPIPLNDYTYLKEYLDSYIPKKMNDNSIIGLSVSVISDKETLFSKGFGYADKGSDKKVTTDTIFRTASVSKIINLIVTMKLIEEGKLNLDKDISQYLPELKWKSRFKNSKPITIRSILTHHSGIPSDRMKGFFSHEKTDSLEKLISDVSGEYVSYPPDYIFSYSNLAHSVLGRIIEKTTNQSYSQTVKEKLFIPLGMKNSTYEMNLENKDLFSLGYGGLIFKSDGKEPKLRDLPAGFLLSSVNDLSKVIQIFLNNGKVDDKTFLKESTLQEIYKIQNAGNALDDDFKIGLSFFINTFGLGDEIFSVAHGGDTFLFHAMLGILPKEKIGVIVLSNTNTSAPLVYDVAKQALQISLETKTGYRVVKKEPVISKKIITSDYAGIYQNGAMMKIDVEEDKVSSKVSTGVKFILPNHVDTWEFAKLKLFGLFTVNLPIEFKFKSIEKEKLIYIKVGGNVLLWGSKINEEPLPELWQKRLGKYKILNPDLNNASMIKDPELIYENGYLILLNNGIPAANVAVKMKLVLKVLNDSEAIVAGLGRGKGDTLLAKNSNGKEILTYSGYEMQKIN